MADAAQPPGQVISLPQGGGALRGLGEKFAPDLHTGTGNFTVPLQVPAGRAGMEPKLELVYSTGNGNGLFGLGWGISIPGVSRKTSHGVPVYDDARDVFLLSGAEDLVAVDRPTATAVGYRPRTEGLFARILHHRGAAGDYWEVAGKDGMRSRYGTRRPTGAGPLWRDPAVTADPSDQGRIFAWSLTETADPLGNKIVYEYEADEGVGNGHRWCGPLLRRIQYADYDDESGTTRFLASVTFDYEDRPDPFSSYRAGFESRTTRRCRSVTTAVHPGVEQPVRCYKLEYRTDPHTWASLLWRVLPLGFDEAGGEHGDLPPLEFGYTCFAPEKRSFQPVRGADLPATSLSGGDLELVDVTSDGLPDLLELNGTARYWRNLGDGSFDRARPMQGSPTGLRLSDPGVQLLDADGDGRADLLVARPGLAGYVPLRFGAVWDRFRPYPSAPSFSLDDPEVRLLDLNGDGVTGALRAGGRQLECWFNDPERCWTGPERVRHHSLPVVSFTDPRVRLADLTGDGLQDLVMLHNGDVRYWPSLGRGKWGDELRMAASPRLPYGYDPRRVLLGDVSGNGSADVVYVGDDAVHVWFNRSGNRWSEPVVIKGTPAPGPADTLRIIDLLGTGTPGILWNRNAPAAGRSAMFFLDLTGGVKPRLLAQMDNGMGATTRVGYRPSTYFSRADDKQAATRWRTPLPIVVPVVERVEVIDAVSRSKLTTEYHYRHGYWHGKEREFRGFACVEQRDSEAFDAYHSLGLHDSTAFRGVERRQYSPPTLTRTWFHPGPVETADGDWHDLDLGREHWPGDPSLLHHAQSTDRFLRTLRDAAGRADRQARSDALRALRGSVLRTELYALDGSVRRDRPYTVTESDYGLREESPPTSAEPGRRRVFFPFLTAQRTTQWERGDDPLTRFTFTDDHDAWGQPRRQTSVAPPRRSVRRRPLKAAPGRTFVPDETAVLASHTRTIFAQQGSGGAIHDRVAQVRTYELVDPPEVTESAPLDVRAVLADQAATAQAVRDAFAALDDGVVRLIGHVVHHYDGAGYRGLPAGQLGAHGLLTRSEALMLTEACLDHAYDDQRPAYLDGTAPLPAGAPADFAADLGYRRMQPDTVYEDGWYADTLCQAHDVQLSTEARLLPERGLVLGIRDALGHKTRITPDAYWLLPAVVCDAADLVTTAAYSYRAGRPSQVTDPNGNTTRYRYHPLGLLQTVFLEGRDGEGGTEARPEVSYTYDFTAFAASGGPVNVRTRQRVWHARDTLPPEITAARDHDEVIETREYSDGFGRLVQKRVQADELAFGKGGDDSGVSPLAGTGGAAHGTRTADRVAVSGWEIHDNKGRVVEKYEPFYDTGWTYQPDARRGTCVTLYYDPRGQLIRAFNPDGSQRRTVFGTPTDLSDPDVAEPSPWTMTAYDENDLAPVSTRPDGTPLTGQTPAAHHWTPTTTVADALGRTLCQLVRGGADPARDGHATRTSYDIRGNILAITDELGRTAFQHAYDLANRPLRVTSIDAGEKLSVLDAAGNLLHSQDADRRVTLRTYDELNRPTAIHARDTAAAPLTLRERLTYGDQSPQRDAAAAANRLGRLWLHHDEAGLLTAERYDFAGTLVEQLRQVISDAALAAAEPDGWTANWAAHDAEAALDPTVYRTNSCNDALGRAVLITAPEDVTGHRARILPAYSRSGALRSVSVDGTPYVSLLAHNARGQRVLLAYGTGPVTRYTYDPHTFRLTRLRTERMTRGPGDVWTSAGPALQDLTYRYDLTGNITRIEERTTDCGIAGTADRRDKLVRHFTYDAFNRLTSATGRACATIGFLRPLDNAPRCGSYPAAPTQANAPDVTTGYRENYRYDEAGNLLDLLYEVTTGPAKPSWHRTFTLGTLNNQLKSVANGSETPLPISYDASGNMETEGDSRHYLWDHAGRLAGFRTTAGMGTSVMARYLYGADGIRVKKWVRKGGNASTDESTVYLGNLAEHHRWTKQGGGANSLLHVLDGANRIALVRTGPPHPDDAGPAVRYELADHLSSSALTLDASGTLTNREEYFAYGETSFGGFARKRYRFTGAERDMESSLDPHGFRFYAPSLARWVSCDPGGAFDGPNLYQFVRDNPVNGTDPAGLATARAGPEEKPDVNVTASGVPPANSNYGRIHNDRHQPEVHGAWPANNLWTPEYVEKYREYAVTRAEEYQRAGISLTCEDFALSLVMDFARANELPVVITTETGRFSSTDPKYDSFESFKHAVLAATSSKDLQLDANAVVVPFVAARPGDILINRNKSMRANHVQVITSLTDVMLAPEETRRLIGIHQGTAWHGSSDPQNPLYTGRPIELGHFDVFADFYENTSTGAKYLQFSEKKRIETRSWQFGGWNAEVSTATRDYRLWRALGINGILRPMSRTR
ncbi:SpvB/TcaC N-terminal domain-containing protein [Streptomyces sp. NPDC002758]